MIVIRKTKQFRSRYENCVATIGKFDGVHLGHQLILDQLKVAAEQLELPSVVILLEPHPEEFFAQDSEDCPARLTDLPEKLKLIEACGVDMAFELKFDKKLSQLSADDYIRKILVQGLGVRSLIIGHDFRFGHKRQGNLALLRRCGKELDFTISETMPYERNGQRISSTFVREQLELGELALVEQLLGRPYSISGEVVEGQQLGANLDFPTCNIRLQRRRIPLQGVFACQVKLEERCLPAAVNIGFRPTVSDSGDAWLEAHILDFDENIYGARIEVIFRHKIRDEVRFDSVDELKQQLAIDVESVRDILAQADKPAK
ncbi:MAG: bifunctional riboflavin kinase/FAD synthetase [Pseudohongiellaceae bacterium]